MPDRPFMAANQDADQPRLFNSTVFCAGSALHRLADAPVMNFQTSTHCSAWLLTAEELVRCRTGFTDF